MVLFLPSQFTFLMLVSLGILVSPSENSLVDPLHFCLCHCRRNTVFAGARPREVVSTFPSLSNYLKNSFGNFKLCKSSFCLMPSKPPFIGFLDTHFLTRSCCYSRCGFILIIDGCGSFLHLFRMVAPWLALLS